MVRFLSSTRLAVALCLILAADCVAGSLLYNGNTAFGGQGSFNLFRSPLFLVPAGLLIVNILVCAGRRLASRSLAGSRAWTFAGIHLGLVLLAAGMIADGILGFVGTRNYYAGVPSSEYFNWRTLRQETFPFTVEVTDAAVRYHPLNLQIGVRDAAGNKLGLYTVREGVSFRVREAGVVVTPRRFDPQGKTLLFDVEAGGRSLSGLVAGPQGAPPVHGVSVAPVSWHDPEPSEFVARVRFAAPGRAPEDRVIRVNDPATFVGISFCLVGQSEDKYRNAFVGLQMTREPGEPLFWGGGLLFGTALLLHMVSRRARSDRPLDARSPAEAGRSDGPLDARSPAEAEAGGGVAGEEPGPEPETAGAGRGPGPVPTPQSSAGRTTVLLLAAAGIAIAAGPARAASGVVIAADAAWEGEVTVAAPVTVEKGATLRIRPGTRVLLSGEDRDGDGCRDGYIQVFGRLIVEGEKGRPVRFLPLKPGLPWQEIFLKEAAGVIRHAEFSGAMWALHIHDGDVRVEHAVFRNNSGGARLKGTGASFSRCTFRDNGVALRFWEGGPAVADSIIEGNRVGLFYRDGAGGGRFRGNRIGNREWNLKVGDWAAGDLDASGNWWSDEWSDARNPAKAGGSEASLVQDYRENKEGERIRLLPALPAPPAVCGADNAREEQR